MDNSDRPESDQPTKRAKTGATHDDDDDAPGDEMGALALSLEATLGFGAVGNDDAVNGAPADEVGSDTTPLLEHVIAYLATSTDLVRTRAVCRAFREKSDMSADAKNRKLIGNGVRPMVGQDVVGLLHGAERLHERTREKLREWDDDAAQAAGIVCVGIPTLAIPPTADSERPCRWEIIVLVNIFDEDIQGCLVPVKVRVGYRANLGYVPLVAGLPDGFFHPHVKNNGVVNRKILVSSGTLLSNIGVVTSLLKSGKKWRNVWRTVEDRIEDSRSYDIMAFSSESYYDNLFTKCLNNFVGYELGEPLPVGLEAFRDECIELHDRMKLMVGGDTGDVMNLR